MPILLKHACIHKTFWGVAREVGGGEIESGLYAVSFAEFLREGGGQSREEFLPVANNALIPMQNLPRQSERPTQGTKVGLVRC